MDGLLTIGDVARLLRKTPRGVAKDRSAGRLGPVEIRLGRSVRFSAAEVADWIRAGCPSRDAWLGMRDRVLGSAGGR